MILLRNRKKSFLVAILAGCVLRRRPALHWVGGGGQQQVRRKRLNLRAWTISCLGALTCFNFSKSLSPLWRACRADFRSHSPVFWKPWDWAVPRALTSDSKGPTWAPALGSRHHKSALGIASLATSIVLWRGSGWTFPIAFVCAPEGAEGCALCRSLRVHWRQASHLTVRTETYAALLSPLTHRKALSEEFLWVRLSEVSCPQDSAPTVKSVIPKLEKHSLVKLFTPIMDKLH